MSQKQPLGASSFWSRSMGSLVVGLLYVAACACPAVKVENRGLELMNLVVVSLGGKPDVQGPEYIEVLGVETLLAGWPPLRIIPWSANILLLVGWLLLCKKNTGGLCLGIAAVLAGLTTGALLPEQTQLLVGSYLWLASLIAFALSALAIWFWNQEKPTNAVRAAMKP